MKPPISEKVVFGRGRPAAERIRRGRQVGARVLDSVGTPASYRYSERSLGRRRMAETRQAQKYVATASDTLRRDLRGMLESGVQLESPTKQGGKITASGITHDEGLKQKTTWSLTVESAGGRTSEFAAEVNVSPGGQWMQWTDRTSLVHVDVIDPRTGQPHNADSYVGEGGADAYRSVATALGQLHRAHTSGTLVVRPMVAEAQPPQPPPADIA